VLSEKQEESGRLSCREKIKKKIEKRSSLSGTAIDCMVERIREAFLMEETKYIYADKSEYPEVCVQEKNRQYAAAMLGNVGACDSEMSAVSLYFYNGVIAEGKFEEIAECFHKISIVEMHHLHTFATLANLLGADPRMWSVERGRYRYWSGACNQYSRNIGDILQNALRGEQQTIAKYRRQKEWIQDCHIRKTLERIILDEQCHVKIFEQLCDRYVH
jgi:rubrerythrin